MLGFVVANGISPIQTDWGNCTDRPDPEIVYIDARNLTVSGQLNSEENYARLSQKYRDRVRPPVWSLSRHSAGINIRFKTNSPEIWVKWELAEFSHKGNMTAIGASGLDLYCKVGSGWQYVNSGTPQAKFTEVSLISEMDGTLKEFLINLPLYSSVIKLEVGILEGSVIERGEKFSNSEAPIVFYGTSITQGASASRPGMAYPSIISRNLDMETINLGFSGNGRFEQSVGQVLCDASPGLIVIDCTPNSSPEVIQENAFDLLFQIRGCHPNVPILMVESILREYSHFKTADDTVFGSASYIRKQNQTLQLAYKKAVDSGMARIFYLKGDSLIGDDHEGTVDGTHLSDLGMMRIAERIQHEIQKIMQK